LSILKFRPEIWSARLLVALRQNLVYSAFINRDYEGEIANAGDTVRITSIGRPSINNYVPNQTTITPEQVNDSQRTLVVDQAKYFAFAVDDVDARQAIGNVIPQALDEASFNLANIIDQYIASFYTSIQANNQLGAITVNSSTTPSDAYDKVLVPLKVRLDKANVPTQGRNVVVSPDLHACLLRDSRFIKVNESGTSDGLRNGQVGRAAGFDIMLSNQTPTTGSDSVVIAGNSTAITFAEQINKVEAYRPQSSFSDAVKGLALYGAKVIRPDSLASANVTVS
jgi:N4-gp56 family major capsid protein